MKGYFAFALAFYAFGALTQAFGQTVPGWEKKWNDTVAAAKKEGKVVVMGPPDTKVREAIPAAFKAKYGITVEYLGGRSSETAVRMRAERAAGISTIDAALSGIETMGTVFYAEKMLDPLDDTVLLLPEVTEGKYWRTGKPWFMDPDGKYILRLFNSVTRMFFINTTLIKPEELKSSKDLINPKWKGKIIVHDPRIPGTGSQDAARLYLQLGEDFVKKLYIEQQPTIVRDRRQITDGISRGAFAIALGAEDEDVNKFIEEGMPLHAIYELDDVPGMVSGGVGEVALIANAPHPNAARVFINWISSKEGLELYSRVRGGAPTRSDIDASSFLAADTIPKPGREYFDSYGWEFTLDLKPKFRERMQEWLKK
jgi:ABC-type Fe3+ transport system substrate-binding protein